MPSEPESSLRSSLTFPLVLLLIVTAFYWKLVFTYQYDWIWGPDLAQQVLPWLDEEARQFRSGQFPIWNTHSWLGQTFIGQAQPGVAYPLNWILWLMPSRDGHIPWWALQWYYVAIHYMGALFSYLLCRDLKRSRGAALIGGLAFGLAGYVGVVDWPQMVNGAVWAPLVFLFLLRAVRGDRPLASAVLSGTAIGMAWLAGHHQVPIFLTLASAGVWIYYVLREGHVDWRIARLAVVAMIFSPIVGAFQILPAQEYGRAAWRWAGAADHLGWKDPVPYNVHIGHSLHPLEIFGIVLPNFIEGGSFLGVVVVTLALLAIAVLWREHLVKLFGALAIGAVVYALGGNSVFNGFIYAVIPFVEKARVPTMAMLIFDVGFVVLAAFGVDALRAGDANSPWVRRINWGIGGFAALLGASLFIYLALKNLHWDFDDRYGITFLCAMLMAILLYAWRAGNLGTRQSLVLLTMLLLLELGNQAGFMLADRNNWGRHQYGEKAMANGDIAEVLHRVPGLFRVERGTPDVVGNWGTYHNFDFVRAQDGVTVNAFKLEGHLNETQKLLGVRYVISREPTAADQREYFRGSSGVAVYENPAPFPRAWTVHQLATPQSDEQVRETIRQDVDSLRTKAFVSGTLPSIECSGTTDQVAITSYRPTRVAINVDMSCPGMLVLSDNYYPGWEARVDGRPAKIHEVDLALRGVVAAKGAHEVVFRYRPRSVILGFVLTLIGWTGAAAITIFSRKKTRLVEDHK